METDEVPERQVSKFCVFLFVSGCISYFFIGQNHDAEW